LHPQTQKALKFSKIMTRKAGMAR